MSGSAGVPSDARGRGVVRGEVRGAVVVTGASSGIGEAIATRLADRGFRAFGGYRNPEDAERLSAAGVEPIRLDVTEPADVDAAVRTVAERLHAEGGAGGRAPGLAGLVNNAGIPGAGPVELAPFDVFESVMAVNFFGALRATRAFLPLLRSAGGRIVMISSLSGRVAMPFLGPYAASKYALEGLADSLRRELLPEGLRVLLIEPGPIATPIWDRVASVDPTTYAGTRYEERVRSVRESALASGRGGLPPERVAHKVERALTSRRPRERVVVTDRAGLWKARLVRRLPVRWADRLIVRGR